MISSLAHLIEVLTPTALGDDRYRGLPSRDDGAEATFGGHFLGQATAAALATVDDERRIHSLHGYFLRAGRPGEPFDLDVERVRDGRSFCTRRVRTSQGDGKAQFELIASFVRPEGGPIDEPSAPPGFSSLPDPETLPTYAEMMSAHDPLPLPAEWVFADHGIDVRTIHAPWAPTGPSADGGISLWIRAKSPLPDDPNLHAAMLAYQSDESISDNSGIAFGVTWSDPGVVFVSLDHALWFHRPFRFDDWLHVEQRPIITAHSRGLSTASVWDRDGHLVASFTQEALLRIP